MTAEVKEKAAEEENRSEGKIESVDNVEEKLVSESEKEKADDTQELEKIVERLLFFFSDANLRIDSFMRRELLGTKIEPSNGLIKIETLLTFNSIKSISSDPAMIVKAAKLDACLSKIKLNEDETAISRNTPFTWDMMDGHIPLSLRVDNIPVKESDEGKRYYDVTRQDIEELFNSQEGFGPVALVRLQYYRRRRNEDEESDKSKVGPKGWALVEFECIEELQKAETQLCCVEGEEKPKVVLTLGQNVLNIQNFKKWIETKPDKKRKVPSEDCDKKNSENEEVKDSSYKVEFKPFTLDWEKGCAIRMKGLGDNCDREAIVAAAEGFFGKKQDEQRLVFADFSRGQTDGVVRFHESNDKIADFIKKLNDGEITIAASKVESAVLLEGEEEEEYYKKFIAFKNKQRATQAEERSRKRARNGGKRGGNGRGRGGGRRKY